MHTVNDASGTFLEARSGGGAVIGGGYAGLPLALALAERGHRALVFGAGAGAVLLLQELRQNPALDYRPVGFVDDDTAKQGAIIQGLRVLGACQAAGVEARRIRVALERPEPPSPPQPPVPPTPPLPPQFPQHPAP